MTCPICDNKPLNCDCTELERRQHEEIERLTAEVERLRMTEAERVSIQEVIDYLQPAGQRHQNCVAATLRGLLERTK